MKLRYLALALATTVVQQGLSAANNAIPNPQVLHVDVAGVVHVTADALKTAGDALQNLGSTATNAAPTIPPTAAPEVVAQQVENAFEVLADAANPANTAPGYAAMAQAKASQALCTIQCALVYAYQTGNWLLIDFIRESLVALGESYGVPSVVTEVGIYVARGVVILLAVVGVHYTVKIIKKAGKGTWFAICHPIQAGHNVCNGACSVGAATWRGTCSAVAATCKGACFTVRHPIQAASIACSCVASPFRRNTKKTEGSRERSKTPETKKKK